MLHSRTSRTALRSRSGPASPRSVLGPCHADVRQITRRVATAAHVCDVAIVGGGLGGLALAAGLIKRGYDVRVFEAAPALRTSTATMIGLGVGAFACLDLIHPAISPALKSRGSDGSQVSSCIKADKSQDLVVQKVPQLGRYTIRWSEIQQVLAELVPPEAVHCGHRTTGYTEDGSGRVKVHFKDQEDAEARLVIASDGIRSPIRATMLPNDPGPRFLGQMNWNLLLHNPNSSLVQAHEPDESKVYMDYLENDKRTLSCVISDAGAGYTYASVTMRSETPSFTADPAQPEAAQQAPGAMQPQPYIVGGGKGRPGSKARLLKMFEERGWDVPYNIIKATPESDIFERALLDRVPLDQQGATMVSTGGRVVLLGDAAHAMHFGPGQGGRTAFEDAHTLTEILDKHRNELTGWQGPVSKAAPAGADEQGVKQVTAEYNALRLVRTSRIQRFSAENSGLASVREVSRPEDAPTAGPAQLQRGIEFLKWMDQYPKCIHGDPTSTYWQPMGAQ